MADEDQGNPGAGRTDARFEDVPHPMSVREIERRAATHAEDPLAMTRLSAEQDQMMQLNDLESRVTQYWIDYKLVLFAGIPGVLVFIASIFADDIARALGHPLGGYAGYIRLGMMFVAALLIFIGWPRRTRRGESVEEANARRDAALRFNDDFRRRHGR